MTNDLLLDCPTESHTATPVSLFLDNPSEKPWKGDVAAEGQAVFNARMNNCDCAANIYLLKAVKSLWLRLLLEFCSSCRSGEIVTGSQSRGTSLRTCTAAPLLRRVLLSVTQQPSHNLKWDCFITGPLDCEKRKKPLFKGFQIIQRFKIKWVKKVNYRIPQNWKGTPFRVGRKPRVWCQWWTVSNIQRSNLFLIILSII